MNQPILWEQQKILKTVSNITPQLVSWDKSTHQTQVRLRTYLDELMGQLLPLPSSDVPLFLHFDIGVKQPAHLMKHHNLENYLTPLFGMKQLDSSRFVLATARKYISSESQITLGIARPADVELLNAQWSHFSYIARGSVQTKEWKENLRNALAATNPTPLATHAVHVQIAFTYSPRRNWVNLWKTTGDCMRPILGEQNPLRPFAPNDDHVVDLQLHRTTDSEARNDVRINMWWRAAED